jgi:hypothetical protein
VDDVAEPRAGRTIIVARRLVEATNRTMERPCRFGTVRPCRAIGPASTCVAGWTRAGVRVGLVTVVLVRLAHRRWSLPAGLLADGFSLALVVAVAIWTLARFPLWIVGATAVSALAIVELAARSVSSAEIRRRERQHSSTMALQPTKRWDLPGFGFWHVLSGLLGWLADGVLGTRRG